MVFLFSYSWLVPSVKRAYKINYGSVTEKGLDVHGKIAIRDAPKSRNRTSKKQLICGICALISFRILHNE